VALDHRIATVRAGSVAAMTVVLIVIVVLFALGYLALTLVVKQKRAQGAQQVREALGGDEQIKVFEDKAISRGTESGPFNNLVGMGTLAFNGEELLFRRWSPEAELRISAVDLLSHTFTTEFNGKSYAKPLLQLTYRNPEHTEGETPGEDQIAFEVTDPDAWDAALKV
jgi:hypothetical protein